MTDPTLPDHLADLPPETREFLARLSREDIIAMQSGLPVLKRIIGAGQLFKWLAIFALSLLAGIVLLGESVSKILGWFKGP